MKKKIIMALATGAMVAAMAMPTGVFADNQTNVGVVPDAVRPDPADASVIVTIPADAWFANAAAGETINNFNLQAKVLKDGTYVNVDNVTNQMPSGWTAIGAKAKSETNGWNLVSGDSKIPYEYYTGSSDGTNGSVASSADTKTDVDLPNMTNADSTVEGYLKITNVDSLTAADAGNEFKDTITFTFEKNPS